MSDRLSNFEGIEIPDFITGGYLKFPERRIHEVLENPTQSHDIRWQELYLRLVCSSSEKFTDLVAIQVDPAPQTVWIALRAFPDLCTESIAEMPPLDLLTKIVHKYGVYMVIAGNRRKFFLTTEFPSHPNATLTELVQISAPAGHKMVLSSYIFPCEGKIMVAMAFCIDADKYCKRFKRG